MADIELTEGERAVLDAICRVRTPSSQWCLDGRILDEINSNRAREMSFESCLDFLYDFQRKGFTESTGFLSDYAYHRITPAGEAALAAAKEGKR